MARRYKPAKRVAEPDPRFGDRQVQSFINRLMKGGKKSTARRVVYGAIDIIEERTGKPGIDVFKAAIKEISPVMEVRPRRVGGATYQVPLEVGPHRQFALVTRWVIGAARERSGKTFSEKLADELIDGSNKQGSAYRKREEAHRMAEANRAFSHYRV